MNYAIILHQSTGENQTVYTSNSIEEITKLWEQEKALDDDYTEFDEELTLRQSSDGINSEMIDCYLIKESQKGNWTMKENYYDPTRQILFAIAFAVFVFSTLGVSNIKHSAICDYINTNRLVNAQPAKYSC